jgi:phosphoglycolate phosphatase
MICAPFPAASRMRHSAFARFSLGSREQAIWIRPTRNLDRCTSPLYDRNSLVTYPALVLFDIDGTLVRRAGPHHREALVLGVHRVTGLETTTEGIPVQGMLDPDILTVMMRRAGATRATIRESMPEILRAAERHYLRVCPALHDKRCPAVEPVLQRLTRRGVLLGLVTGNLTRIGWRKLDRAGLRPYFRFGAFGEMAKTRAGLARIAIREARRRGWIDRRAPISLIGDAPADVIAARANRIRSIAVQTGITPVAELRAEEPDFLLANLRELRLRMVETA